MSDRKLIANFKTGLDNSLEPWLTMDDAAQELLDYRMYRGVIRARKGITGFAEGGMGSAENEQSRIYRNTEVQEIITDEDVADTTTITGNVARPPVLASSITFTDPGGGTQTVTDDGSGNLIGDVNGAGNNTFDYVTGAYDLTWASAPAGDVTVSYTSISGEDVADTTTITGTLSYVTVRPGSITFYDPGSGRTATDDGSGALTGDVSGGGNNTINYQTGAYDLTWSSAPTGDVFVTYIGANGEPVMGIFNFVTATNTRKLVVVDQSRFNVYNTATNRFNVIPFGSGSSAAFPTGGDTRFFSGTMYPDKNGAPRLIMTNNNTSDNIYFYDGTDIKLWNDSTDNADYVDPPSANGGALTTCLHVFYIGERLLCLRPTLGGTVYQNRLIWTGILDASGNGDSFTAASSGYLDLATEFWITGAARLRDKLIIWTTENVWELAVTSDIDLPFRVRQIGDTSVRGAQAPFSAVTHFGQSEAVGTYGFMGTDGRDSFRVDGKIPFFTQDRMGGLEAASSNQPFDYVVGGMIHEEQEIWWTYPDTEAISSNANRCVTRNYLEDNWAVNRIQATTFGRIETAFDIAWDDVNGDVKDHWAAWDTTWEKWDSLSAQEGLFITLIGDENGFIYQLSENMDQSAGITNITSAGPAVVSCEPDVFKVGDRCYIGGVSGYEVNSESLVNNQTFDVTAVSGADVTIGLDGSSASAYSSGGVISRVIQRSFTSKPLNPYVQTGQKCRLKSIWLLISTDRTIVKLDFYADDREDPYLSNLVTGTSSNFGQARKKWVKIRVNQVANFHTLRIRSESAAADEEIHAILLETDAVGRAYR